MMYQLNFFKLFEHKLLAIFGSPIFMFFYAYSEKAQNEARRCRRRCGMKLSAIGEGAQLN